MNILTVKNLEKNYKTRQVVKNVSLELHSGEVIGLLGPNGAGKTTSFYMIVGLIRCNGGTVTLNGEDITDLPMHLRARKGIGYLPQECSIFRKLTVAENIMAILELRNDLSKAERLSKLDNLLTEFHISHLRNAISMSLSGGEKRRVEIARALAMDPNFILLDEPFAGIDPISVIDIKRIVHHLCGRGLGILITDHNVRETLAICQKAYIVNQGEIIAFGTPTEILNNVLVREVYLGNDFDL
ncbi:MAG: LPS export ABC transporter ATP-binding protein [Gammaproteobacteria bacterium]|nr:LPS export ABC transporter ATP-binding protein [Gammaproteobacteria bacterium]